jgi:2-polyprenyl-6-methoxyphenol hydroxylase-like FAD-dependent oxidoreductase
MPEDDFPFGDPTAPKQRSVIIGAGPTGLLQALFMCQRGHDVTVLEKRENYISRENSLLEQQEAVILLLKNFTNFYQCGYQIEYRYTGDKINIDITHDPKKITDPNAKLEDIDKEFIKELQQANDDIATNAFQKYVLQKQKSLQNKHRMEIVTQAEAIDLDPNAKSLHYVDAKNREFVELGYDNLFICEGAHRTLTNKIIDPKQTIAMENPDDVQCAHGVGFMNVPPELLDAYKKVQQKKPLCGVILPLTVSKIRYKRAEFKALGWGYKSTPKFYIAASNEPPRFYFVGEIPKAWQSALEKAKESGDPNAIAAAKKAIDDNLEKWFRIAISAEYPGIDPEKLFIDRTGNTQAQSFMAKTPTLLQTPFVKTKSGGRIFFVGDALFTPHYKLGMGLLFGAISTKAAADCFDTQDGSFVSATPTIKLLDKLQKEYQRMLSIFKLAVKVTEKLPLTYKYVINPAQNVRNYLLWLPRQASRPSSQYIEDITNGTNKEGEAVVVKPKMPR